MSTTRVKQFVTFHGYMEIFYDNCRGCKTFNEAFELTEDEYFEIFGVNRFSSYKSFDNAKRKFLGGK
jgi:hypothetical protein